MNNLEKLRIIELDILDEFVRICKKNDLNYYLAYGTLIGAVRHKGFIPWDDDIDVWMLREDYDKFAKIAQSQLNEKYFYQDYHTDPDYPYNFAKIRINGTKFVQAAIDHIDMHHGIYIDIFPLDGAVNDNKKMQMLLKKNKLLKILLSIISMDKKRSGIKRNFLQRAAISIVKLFFNKKSLHNKLEAVECTYEAKNSDYLIYQSSTYNKSKICMFSKSSFETDELLFNGKCYTVPKDYDIVLKTIYGEYMSLPPIEKQVSNHETLDIDFGDYFTVRE